MNKSTQDAGIPVLTEVIQPPPKVVVAPQPETPAIHASPVDEIDPLEADSTEPINGWLDEEWTRMEQKVSARTLTQLMEHINPVLEQQIRDGLAASIEGAVADIRRNLQQTLEQLVREAVAQEIENLQLSKK
jgi:hypothetical protein